MIVAKVAGTQADAFPSDGVALIDISRNSPLTAPILARSAAPSSAPTRQEPA